MVIKRFLQNFSWKIRVVLMSIKRDFLMIGRYKFGLIGWFFNMVTGMIFAYVFSVIFEFNSTTVNQIGIFTKTQIIIFIFSGVLLNTFSSAAIWAPMGRVTSDIHLGTLEAVFVSPTSRLAYLIAPTIALSILHLLFFIPAYIVVMAINGTLTNLVVISTTLLIVLLTVVSMVSFGIFFAMISMLIRKPQPIVLFLQMIFQYLCGVYVPVQSFTYIHGLFGMILKYFAMIFPYTYCYDLFRYFTFRGSYQTLLPIWAEFLFLGITSIFFIVLANFLLKKAEKKAKKGGLSIL